jgi:molecular chaperone IbpA
MTIEQLLRNDPFFVGFERIADRVNAAAKLSGAQKYPPYNIVKTDDSSYLIELAVAGFKEEDIEIELHDGVITIIGDVKTEEDNHEYVYRGIAARGFERRFTLADTVQVEGVTLEQGILTVKLKNVIPEEKKPRKIAIGKPLEKQLLTE